MTRSLAVVRGGGDIATGTIHRLVSCGFLVVALEVEYPTVIRRTVAFAQAVYDGEAVVEGIKAVRAERLADASKLSKRKEVQILIDPEGSSIRELEPEIVIDAILAKRNSGTSIDMAPIVIGLGPGFTAGTDVHAVIETNRGHNLGRVIYDGCAEADTGKPGLIGGYSTERLVRSPAAGVVRNISNIGDRVKKGGIIAYVGEHQVAASIDGVLRGQIHEGVYVPEGCKIGDIDPRNKVEYCYSISDKARSVAGGVLEAILHLSLRPE